MLLWTVSSGCAVGVVTGVVGCAGVPEVFCRLFVEFRLHHFHFLFCCVGFSLVPDVLVVAGVSDIDWV